MEYEEEVNEKVVVKKFKNTLEIEKEIKKLELEMKKFADNYQYEEAIDRRNKINKLKEMLLELM